MSSLSYISRFDKNLSRLHKLRTPAGQDQDHDTSNIHNRPATTVAQPRGVVGTQTNLSSCAPGLLVLQPTAPQCDNVTPEEFMHQYTSLRVPYVDQRSGCINQVQANVHRYTNDGIDSRKSNEVEKNAIQGLVRRAARRGSDSPIRAERRSHNVAIAHAYFGKAAPWEFRVYLAYALTFGRLTPGNLVDYCDERAKLGIDCSGFVNSYLLAIGAITRAQGINQYKRNSPRQSKTDIQPRDLLVWDNGGAHRHIAIIDHIITTDTLRIVESSGSKGGLKASDYEIREELGAGAYSVHRGNDENNRRYQGTDRVKIVSPV